MAPAPGGFTTADFAARVRKMAGEERYTVRQAAYDVRKLRGKNLAVKPGRSRRYRIPGRGARTIVGLLTLRDQAIAPILAGSAGRRGRKPATWTAIDCDYENLRIGMQPSSAAWPPEPRQPPHRQHFGRSEIRRQLTAHCLGITRHR